MNILQCPLIGFDRSQMFYCFRTLDRAIRSCDTVMGNLDTVGSDNIVTREEFSILNGKYQFSINKLKSRYFSISINSRMLVKHIILKKNKCVLIRA